MVLGRRADQARQHRLELLALIARVSLAASTLRDKGIIDYRRGVLTIRNTARLHKVACECFDIVSLAAGLPAPPPPSPRVRTTRKR